MCLGYDGSGSGSAEDVIEQASAVGYRCTEVQMEFADFQIFTGPDEVKLLLILRGEGLIIFMH
jgi:hypothetical protein